MHRRPDGVPARGLRRSLGVSRAHGWLGPEWNPEHFELDEVNDALALAVAEPVSVSGEFAELAESLEQQGVRVLRHVLAQPASHGSTEVSDPDAVALTEAYRIFLDVVGDGVKLTGAGYLPPSVVTEIGARTGLAEWWFGKVNREDKTPPIAHLRGTARALGLVSVRKGVLNPTAAGRRLQDKPQALLARIIERLPLGKDRFDRQSGWLTLAFTGSEAPLDGSWSTVGELLYAIGWRYDGHPGSVLAAHSPTRDVLRVLGGELRTGCRRQSAHPALGGVARAVVHRP